MSRHKDGRARARFLRRVRRQRLKYVAMLPALVTILNGVCGFGSLLLAAKGHFAGAGYMIFMAMIADMLDGRLARMSHSTSSFGGQLDSLCDVVSFGAAPAFLMVQIVESKLSLQLAGTPGLHFMQRFIWLAAAVYLSCAIIRLARFNVENEEDETAHMSFVGLPTPAAAGTVVSLVIFHQEIVLPAVGGVYGAFDHTLVYTLPFAVFGMGVLMVSRIRYPHILNVYLKGRKPFDHLIRAILFLGVIVWNRQAALAVIFCLFTSGSFVRWVYLRVLRKTEAVAVAPRQPDSQPDGRPC